MASTRAKKLIGVAMIAVGLVQVSSFAWNDNLLFSITGALYVVLGVTWLWTEVYSPSE